jgi:putative hydrolase of the HAD superfamily
MMSTMTHPQALLFDLGGVLIDWPGIAGLVDLARGACTPEEARQRWLRSPWVREHETGACSTAQFARGVVAEFGLPVTADQFLAAYNSWMRGPFAGALTLLEELSGSYHLACLSNVSQAHWDRLEEDARSSSLIRTFRHRFVSFEMGRMKPDRAAFEYVLEELPFPAGRIAFFDDNRECVETARALGLPAFEVRGVEAVRTALAGMGIELAGDIAA